MLLGCRTRVRVKDKAADVELKTVRNEEEACAREEKVCAHRVDWEQSLFVTRTDFPWGEGSTSTFPLPRFPTLTLERLLSGGTTTTCVHPPSENYMSIYMSLNKTLYVV